MSEEHIAKVNGKDLPISTKNSIEVCNFIRNKTVADSKRILQGVLEEKRAIPAKRFNKDRGHKRGRIAAGIYPKNVCRQIMMLLESAEANAQNKGLNVDNLIIKSITVNKASAPWRYGRFRRRKTKRTHISVVVEEVEKKPKEGAKK